MQVRQLLQIIEGLPASLPITEQFEGTDGPPRRAWYASQKEHLHGWLSEYGTPGAYGRSQPGQDVRHFYTHFQCAAGLLWLAEALGEDHTTLHRAAAAVRAAGRHTAAQCGAFRRVIPWARVERLLRLHALRTMNRAGGQALSRYSEKMSATAFLKSGPSCLTG